MVAHFPKGTLLSLGGPVRGVTISCESGLLWITQLGDARDYVLTAGANFSAYREEHIVVQVIRDARISLGFRGSPADAIRLCLSTDRRECTIASLSRWKHCFLTP